VCARLELPQTTTGRDAQLTQQLLVGAEAVSVRAVKHGDPQLMRPSQRRQTLGLRRLGPRRVGDREAWDSMLLESGQVRRNISGAATPQLLDPEQLVG
jgi:hypothetical protein